MIQGRRERIQKAINHLSLQKVKRARVEHSYPCVFCACAIATGQEYRTAAGGMRGAHEYCFQAVAKDLKNGVINENAGA